MKRLVMKKWFVAFLVIALVGSSLFLYFNRLSSIQNSQVKAANLKSSSNSDSPCPCDNKANFNKLFIVPQEADFKNLILVTKKQKIYNEYKEFLEKKGYIEYTNNIAGGFFRNNPVIKKNDVRIADYKFSYDIDLNIRKSYLLSIPYVDPFDDNKIAGIIFVYSQQRVLSYMVEVNGIKDPKSVSVDILIENNDGEIASASNIATPDFYIDWSCVWSCIPGALWNCVPFIGTAYLSSMCSSSLGVLL